MDSTRGFLDSAVPSPRSFSKWRPPHSHERSQAFHSRAGHHRRSDIFTRAIIGLSNGLELCVTAEGVETDAQVEALSKLGAHKAQGFLFGKAMPASEVARLLLVKTLQLAA